MSDKVDKKAIKKMKKQRKKAVDSGEIVHKKHIKNNGHTKV